MRAGSLSGRASITTGERPDWRDKKRYLWLLGAVVPLFLFGGWGLVNLTGLGVFWWMGPIFVYVVIPLLDRAFGDDPSNPPEEIVAWLDKDRYYRVVTYAFLPMQYIALFSTWNAGSRASPWRPADTGTSSSNTTGATTSAWQRPRIPRPAGSANRSGRSGRARSPAASATRGSWSSAGCGGWASAPGRCATTCSTRGR
jgi:hypothetical protein